MPSVNLSPIARRQYLDSNGDPVVGGLLFYYAAGSTTKQSTYTDSSGTVANSNPIVLDASGRTPQGVWFEAGLLYKEVLALSTDTDPPTSPIYTADGLEGVNDTTTPAALASSSQWVETGLAPAYVSATQFTLAGDQTAAFHVGRRLRLTVTAGTLYGRISASAYTTLTTVTVVLDSGALDSGLSAVDVGILTVTNSAMPKAADADKLDGYDSATAGTANTVAVRDLEGDITTRLFRSTWSVDGATPASTAEVMIRHNSTDNYLRPYTRGAFLSYIGNGSTTAFGLMAIATTAEATAGTDTTRAVTPAGLRSGLNAAGTAPIYACRAWVNFNGTLTAASMISASGNVSSITDNGVGDYTINFTTAMQDANYAAQISGTNAAANLNVLVAITSALAGSLRVRTGVTSPVANEDFPLVAVAIFR